MYASQAQASSSNSRHIIKDLLVLFIFISLFYALWIGSYALFTPDEGRYSEVAREMVASNDYITPRLNGVAFLDKPALYYWLQAFAIKTFGLKEWALRFFPATLGVLSCLITYLTSTLLFNRRTGILASIILATSPLFYGAAHYANLDLEVAALIGNSLLCFITAIERSSQRAKNGFLLAAYIFSALAALTKGLIGIAFPAMIIGAWILVLNRWSIIKSMHLIKGLLLFFCITAPWYILVQKANPEFLHFFFVTQQISRFLTTQDFNSKAAAWFYVPVVFAGFFPWSCFLLQSLFQKIKLVWRDRQRYAVEVFLLLWFFIIFIFFSIPRSKTVGYILPLFPVSAVLVGSFLSDHWENSKTKGVYLGVGIFFLVSLITSAVLLLFPLDHLFDVPKTLLPLFKSIGAILLVGCGVTYFTLRRFKLFKFFVCLTVCIGVLLLTFIQNASTLNEKSIKPLAVLLKQKLKPSDEVVTYFRYYQDLPIYLEKLISITADWKASDIPNKDNWLREMWYGMVFQDTKDWLIDEKVFWQRWNSNKHVYVITDERYRNVFKERKNVHFIAQLKDMLLISNQAN